MQDNAPAVETPTAICWGCGQERAALPSGIIDFHERAVPNGLKSMRACPGSFHEGIANETGQVAAKKHAGELREAASARRKIAKGVRAGEVGITFTLPDSAGVPCAVKPEALTPEQRAMQIEDYARKRGSEAAALELIARRIEKALT